MLAWMLDTDLDVEDIDMGLNDLRMSFRGLSELSTHVAILGMWTILLVINKAPTVKKPEPLGPLKAKNC